MDETKPPMDPFDGNDLGSPELLGIVNVLAAQVKTLSEHVTRLEKQNEEQDGVIGAAVIAFQDMAIMLEELIRQLIFDGTEDAAAKREFIHKLTLRRKELIRQLNDNARTFAQGD